ncbi:pyridoxal-phosphate dependent enzyme [Alkalitalea saponilacus]|uniref:Threonine dehydratase n=1 Tax=Alkalitalea saponilacus TaxID=889453 RepID=A0A1T5AFH1_9BACT|nr:pyridoxal-phosphate dependent enzyme [Alkalitalea saponilacus]ASB48725.1 serine dehydratase [Alkalitalea saponilacus]SKB33569.1 threonine dehydratase [Alkalitalea saponilacus]
MIHPTFQDILNAHERIRPYVRQTVVIESTIINRLLHGRLFFKCEHQQKAGAFKFRGATNAVFCLSQEESLRGVATHSSGNHAAALAYAAAMRGIKAHIVMPETAPLVKVENVKEMGGHITFCEPTLKAREEVLSKVVKDTGAVFIHPYDDFNVICGQGTAALDMIKDTGELDYVLTPVGGGGLLSGTSIAVKGIYPACKVIGTEPENADDACRSFYSGTLVRPVNPQTIADGLLTSLSELTFSIIKQNVDEIFTVSEMSIKAAMVMLRKHAGILAEPSSAVPMAAIMENREFFEGKRVGVIISGGNIDPGKYDFWDADY